MGRQVKRPRAHVSGKVKLAAALLTMQRLRMVVLGEFDAEREFYEHSKLMTADQIISLFQFDHHPKRHVDDGPVAPWNLAPLLIKRHRTKTAKVDQPGMAKERRIEAKWREHNRAVAAGRKPPRRQSRWPKRKLQGRKVR